MNRSRTMATLLYELATACARARLMWRIGICSAWTEVTPRTEVPMSRDSVPTSEQGGSSQLPSLRLPPRSAS
jgi:hypothetical protein